MRISAATLQKLLLGSALLLALLWNLAQASEIKGLRVNSGATGTRAEIALDRPGDYKLIRLSAPERLVVDFADSRVAPALSAPAGAGVVKTVRTGQPSPGVARVVFDLAQPVAALKPRIEQVGGDTRLVLEWPGDGDGKDPAVTQAAPSRVTSTTSSPASTPPPSAGTADADASNAATTRLISELAARAGAVPATDSRVPGTGDTVAGVTVPAQPASRPEATTEIANAASSTPPKNARTASVTGASDRAATPDPVKTAKDALLGPGQGGMRPLVIAIDAGHGGQDPGAIGPSGKREKDVVLSIARELARQINATPGMRAYLVRDADVYVERPQRARRARSAKADMFVSIHADAATNRTANGSSVFTLSTRGASSQYARWAADRENASDLVGGVRLEKGTLSSVLLDLAQTGHMKASQDAAQLVLAGLGQVGRNHKRHVEYANFEVLRNADMPAMLVETGFISHPDEERRLSDPGYQRQLARAVLGGISTYFQRQPPPGTLYAARAATDSAVAGTPKGAGGGSP